MCFPEFCNQSGDEFARISPVRRLQRGCGAMAAIAQKQFEVENNIVVDENALSSRGNGIGALQESATCSCNFDGVVMLHSTGNITIARAISGFLKEVSPNVLAAVLNDFRIQYSSVVKHEEDPLQGHLSIEKCTIR